MGIETLAIGSLVSSVAGAGIGALGAIAQGTAAKNAADYQAAVGRNMAKAAEQKGAVDEQAKRMKTAHMVGDQIAIQGASGLSTGSGSFSDVRSSTEQLGDLDAETIRWNAKTKATNLRNEATLDTYKGENAQTAGYLGAASSIMGGATSFSDKWLSYQQKGVFG